MSKRSKDFVRVITMALSLTCFCYFVHLQKRFMAPVEQEDLAAFIRVTLPAVPFWRTYTVIETPSGYVASAADSGTLYRKTRRWDREALRATLRSYVYKRPLWRVLQWPLLGFMVMLVFLAWLGRKLDSLRKAERLIRGASIVSHWRWNWPLWFRRSQRGFFIETK
jgi:hypothetical protein